MLNSFIYQNSPVFIQHIAVSCYELIKRKMRATESSKALMLTLIDHEKDKQALKRYHDGKIDQVLQNAVEHCPFYQKQQYKQPLQLCDFDFTTKENVRENNTQFLNVDSKEIKIEGKTSGTTGTPLSIYQDIASVRAEKAFTDRQLQWAGYVKGDKIGWMRGDMIVPFTQKKPPFWRYSYFENMVLLSSYHMTPKALPQYITTMVDFGVDIIQAYPSSILILAKYLDVNDLYYQGTLKSIVTSSESLATEDKALIEKRFKCPVFDWYGLFERVAAIASCEHGNYHILTDYSHVELIDQGDGYHEIVGTNFNNSLFPLIRYKTGDFVKLSTEKQCACGRVFPMVDHIKGRVGDYLIAEDGQKMHILNHIPKGIAGLIATQFTQYSHKEINALVVVEDTLFLAPQRLQLIQNAQDRLGKSIEVKVEVVNSIPKTKNGKSRQAICTIKED
ncbi:phenylacetate--CoA ligase family protein [Psychromonas sp. Urea-02u-13]|uniref:phenylacetate--CoA ligase family protein n=1 Tax=Psychromonas sp. Urea-02u-13 TaxID=2058326 RepID=UPI000C338569|nr:phenylacetate--CoA ligase family protein [Psychromonas sp. Urea-02u-13]PKG37530.1 capsule biosynthesis protein CapK [Psychromonas sp. Urea-02u-13]